eukprot:scaffold2150_cov98-Alexandrium_tamarense.AAC.2
MHNIALLRFRYRFVNVLHRHQHIRREIGGRCVVASESNEAIDHRRCLSMVTLISKTNNAHHQRRQCIIGTHLLVLMICWLVVDEDVLTVYNHSRLAEWVVAVLMWQVTVENSILSLSRAPRPVVAVIGVVGLREQTLIEL